MFTTCRLVSSGGAWSLPGLQSKLQAGALELPRAMGDTPRDRARGDERGDPAPIGDERSFTAFLVGTGTPEPGATKAMYAARIMRVLDNEADGSKLLPDIGRGCGGWCQKQFLKSMTGAGKESWRFFKATYADRIECSKDQQWVRKRPLRSCRLCPAGPVHDRMREELL